MSEKKQGEPLVLTFGQSLKAEKASFMVIMQKGYAPPEVAEEVEFDVRGGTCSCHCSGAAGHGSGGCCACLGTVGDGTALM